VRREKPGQPTEAEGSYIGWPVVALASLGQESGSPNTQLNETQRYATRANTQRYSSLRHTSVRWPIYSGWPNRASAQASAALHIKRGSPTSPATRSTFWTKLTVHQQHEALARRAAGEALVDIARSYAVSHSTISRLHSRKNEVGQTGICALRAGPHHNRTNGPWPDYGYGNLTTFISTSKPRSFDQLRLGSNQSLSSNFVTNVSNSGGNSFGAS